MVHPAGISSVPSMILQTALGIEPDQNPSSVLEQKLAEGSRSHIEKEVMPVLQS